MSICFAQADFTIDHELQGLTLGPWTMISAWISVPISLIVVSVLLWYFKRLDRTSVPRSCRIARRIGIIFACAGLVPMVVALTFVHPHSNRVGWAFAWTLASLALFAWFVCALVDIILLTRNGWQEYRALQCESIAPQSTAADSDEDR